MDQIPLKDILDFVRPHAQRGTNGTPWCDGVEGWLIDELNIDFVRDDKPCGCGDDCPFTYFLKGDQRFTPVPGSPEMISRKSVLKLINVVDEYYSSEVSSEAADVFAVLKEARELWKL